MKRTIKALLILLMFIPCIVFGKEKEIDIYLFYGEGCPHCRAEEEFLDDYLKDNKNVNLHLFEVWSNENNKELFLKVQEVMDYPSKGVPYLVIGNNVITGFSEGYSEELIENTIKYYKETKYIDKVKNVLSDEPEVSIQNEISIPKYSTETFDIPLLGNVNGKEVSIGLSAVVIGLVDGFNPCAMWILIFLISMLFGMKNKKRMWTLGIIFLTTSAVVYFLFMISWLNLASLLSEVAYIRLAISFFAIIFGYISVVRFFNQKDDGCEVVDTKNRKRIINAIKKIVKEKTFFLAVLGIILLAVSVNVIELLCSLGLPVMFTQILALNDLSQTSKMVYTLIYIFFFLIDDIVIFIIAMKTLEIKAISNKFGKYSHLIGGIIMIIIGALMLVKPEWLMFNF